MLKTKKYSTIMKCFKPGYDNFDYDIALEAAHELARSIKLPMDTSLTPENFLIFSANTMAMAIKTVKKSDTHNESQKADTLKAMESIHTLMSNHRDFILQQLSDKGVSGRDAVVELTKNDVNSQKALGCPYVNTIGGLLIAIMAITDNTNVFAPQ